MSDEKTSKPGLSHQNTALPNSVEKKVAKEKKVKLPTKGPQRAESHRADTRAFRTLLNHLHVDWLVRSMEDRDYGIDLQLEIFDGLNATGVMVFGQLKGTDHSFSEDDSFQFPVKTLLYAELFSTPFFLFRTSNFDNITRFIWLQKYIETKLNNSSPKWRTQGDVDISMPEDNDLAKNPTRFLEIAMEPVRQRQAVEFLRIEHNLVLHANHVLGGQYNQGYSCSSEAKKLEELKLFIVGKEWSGEDDFNKLCGLYTHFDEIAMKKEVSDENLKYVNECLDIIDTIKVTYLGEPGIHGFITSAGGTIYY